MFLWLNSPFTCRSVVKRATHFEHHQIRREQIPTQVRMAEILAMLSLGQTLRLEQVLRGRGGAHGGAGDLPGPAGAVQGAA